jgi:gamma-glutamylcysteine synthetase
MSNKALITVPSSSSEWKEKDSKRGGTMPDVCLDEGRFEEYKQHIASTLENFTIHEVVIPMTKTEVNDFVEKHCPNWRGLGNVFLQSVLCA